MSVKSVLLFMVLVTIATGLTSGCPCPRVYWPVCGSDGHTYSNVQCMRCQKPYLKVIRQGPCRRYEGNLYPEIHEQYYDY